ncbi:threonine/homoserine/homoserine lactone efflux protein [Microbacterium trichothecenolyticum]|uniref:GAP family protein n=1 Tax=Microbacterium trichothecenolyticum TaxID=69370 RepID=UPI00285CB102|nr:GAP family protein [Microbacterium trichothecenolyticum]MDR7183973.1 threonine/homoserine/homoserine lactone efflux protein [Microbacterium trichothecenolyticum]
MGAVVGEILPLALGVAISPIPIIAAILMLLSPRARVTSVGFLLGWVLGIVVAVSVFTLLSSILPEQDEDASKPIQGVIQLVLGAGLLLLALRQWRGRPKAGEEPQMPKWMQAIDKVTFPVACGLGFLLSAINPKNLLLAAAAGVDIGSAGLDVGSIVLVIVVFTLIAASTVLVPVVGYLIAAEKLRGPLDALRVWLSKENAVIMAVLLLVIGVSLIGKGVGSF